MTARRRNTTRTAASGQAAANKAARIKARIKARNRAALEVARRRPVDVFVEALRRDERIAAWQASRNKQLKALGQLLARICAGAGAVYLGDGAEPIGLIRALVVTGAPGAVVKLKVEAHGGDAGGLTVLWAGSLSAEPEAPPANGWRIRIPPAPGAPVVVHAPDGRRWRPACPDEALISRLDRTLTAPPPAPSALAVVVERLERRAEARPATGRAILPSFQRAAAADAAMLPNLGADAAPAGPVDAVLPNLGLEPAATGCPSWLLHLFDTAGGASMQRGTGAPYELRLWIAAVCLVGFHDRTGGARILEARLVDVVERLLHPNGWDNRKRDWAKLPAAFDRLGLLRIPIGDRLRIVVDAPDVPRIWRPDARVVLRVCIPASAAAGARLDWNRLLRYGSHSAPLYRAYLATAAAMSGAASGGLPLTRLLPAPVRRADGQPRRAAGGAIVRQFGPGAALEANPQGRMAPVWSDRDAARFLGFDENNRSLRRNAREALEQLAGDRVIELERLPGGRFRLWGPRREPVRCAHCGGSSCLGRSGRDLCCSGRALRPFAGDAGRPAGRDLATLTARLRRLGRR